MSAGTFIPRDGRGEGREEVHSVRVNDFNLSLYKAMHLIPADLHSAIPADAGGQIAGLVPGSSVLKSTLPS